MPVDDDQKTVLEATRSSLVCLGREDLYVYGRHGNTRASLIEIDLIMCTGQEHCKSEEEIKTFFGDSYMLLLKNQISFDQKNYGSDSIVAYSRFDLIRLGIWQQQ